MSLSQHRPFVTCSKLRWNKVRDLGPDVLGVAPVGLHDIADDGDQRIVALIAYVAHTAAFLMFDVKKIPLKVAPNEMQVQKIPQREVQSRAADKNQRNTGRAYGRIN